MYCSVDGCDKKVSSRGWCQKHYTRWFKHGDPETVLRLLGTVEERFWNQTNKAGPNDCWEWTGSVRRGGYGHIGTNGRKTESSHRIAWKLFRGDVPAGMYVCHSCDNPPCVNPAHLWLGAPSDNVQDCLSKGRRIGASGEKHKDAILTEKNVLRIRRIYAMGKHTQSEIGKRFGVSPRTVSDAVRGNTWKDLPLVG